MLSLQRNVLWLAVVLVSAACSRDAAGRGPRSEQDDEDDAVASDRASLDAGRPRDAKVPSDKDALASKPDRHVTPGEPRVDGGCANGLEIIVRDFTEAHPDFEAEGLTRHDGVVELQLGPDKKPVYAHAGPTPATTGAGEFAQWYNDVDGINVHLSTQIQFVEQSPGVFVYDDSEFFPIDGQGLGNGPATGINIPIIGMIGGGPDHNYLFTTEAHTRFTYQGGEKFTFRGDDDMWIFINDRLAIDLGGLHSAEVGSVKLDAQAAMLGLEKGKTYSMDIFHAERHTDDSNYRIETTIDLSCIENVQIPVI